MNTIVKLVASALPGEKKYVLFAGAGISKDAGIPTAWDLMLKTASLLYAVDNEEIDEDIDIENWFLKSKYSKMSYAELIGLIYPKYPDQQIFFKKYLGGKEPGDAHKGIVELARRKIIRAIITTNFDHYLEKAFDEKGLEYQIISNDEDLKHSEPLIQCKAIRIYKPHGNLGQGALRNTPKDLEKLSSLMEKELIRVLSEHGVLFLGYSGRDKGIHKIIEKRDPSYYPIFWISPHRPSGDIELLLNKRDYCYIKCIGASQFINEYLTLLEKLERLAPSIESGPSIIDLKEAFSSSTEPIRAVVYDYLDNLYSQLEKIRPDFTKFGLRPTTSCFE